MSLKPAKETQTQTGATPEQRKWMGKALDLYGPTLGQGVKIPPGEVGERLAPMTPTQTQATDVQGFLKQFAPYRDMPMFGEGQKALSGILAGETGAAPITPEATERYIEGAIADPRRRAFERFERPAIREEFAGPGFWGSARAKAVGERSQEMEDWIGEMGAQTRWDVEQANRQIEEAKAGRSLAAIEPARMYAGEPTREATARLAGRENVFALSGIQQQQQQAELNMTRQILSEEFAITDPEDLEIILSLLGMPYSSSTGTAEGAGLGYAAISGFMGGMGQGAGYAAGSNIFA